MEEKINIYMASDHAAFHLKEEIKHFLMGKGFSVTDMGAHSPDRANWAEYGAKAAREVSLNPNSSRAIILCGSGIGMSIVANKFKNVRAALCHDTQSAELSRKHNNANVLNIGARVVDTTSAIQIVDTWLNTPFEAGRHQERLDYLTQEVEAKNFVNDPTCRSIPTSPA